MSSHSRCASILSTWMAVACAVAVIAAKPAAAQGYTPIYTLDYGNPGITSDGSVPQNLHAKLAFATALFPYVNFYRSGYLPSRQTGGTEQIVGQLIALDGELTDSKPHRIPVDLGGWYFAQSPSMTSRHYHDDYNLYELHARAYASERRDIGIQVAVLRSTKKAFAGSEYTVFAVTEYSSARLRKRRISPNWAVQGGAGFLIDPSYDPNYDPKNGQIGGTRQTVDPTFFLSGSLDLGHRYNLTLSDWYARDRSQDINRVALGIGYRL